MSQTTQTLRIIPNTAISINSLPEEQLTEIVSYLGLRESMRYLYSASQADRLAMIDILRNFCNTNIKEHELMVEAQECDLSVINKIIETKTRTEFARYHPDGSAMYREVPCSDAESRSSRAIADLKRIVYLQEYRIELMHFKNGAYKENKIWKICTAKSSIVFLEHYLENLDRTNQGFMIYGIQINREALVRMLSLYRQLI